MTRTVVIGEGGEAPLAVTVRELTVGEIRAWLKDLQSESAEIQSGRMEPDLIDVMLLRDVSLQDVRRMSSLTAEQVEGLAPSQLRDVVAAARELNEDFFALRAGLLSVIPVIPSEPSSAQSPA